MKAPSYSSLAIQAKLRGLGLLFNGGSLDLYDGPRPPDADTETPERPLAHLTFASPAFHAPADGAMEAYPLDADPMAPQAGTARWFRCYTGKHEPILDGSVGLAQADLILSDTTILRGTRVEISQMLLTEEKD